MLTFDEYLGGGARKRVDAYTYTREKQVYVATCRGALSSGFGATKLDQ